jgi:hypothetical protein
MCVFVIRPICVFVIRPICVFVIRPICVFVIRPPPRFQDCSDMSAPHSYAGSASTNVQCVWEVLVLCMRIPHSGCLETFLSVADCIDHVLSSASTAEHEMHLY